MNGNSRMFGYARVSSVGQNLDRQIEVLKQYVPEENIVTDKKVVRTLNERGIRR